MPVMCSDHSEDKSVKALFAPPLRPRASASVHQAFVVYLDAGTNVEAGRVAERVEHVVSGEAAL